MHLLLILVGLLLLLFSGQLVLGLLHANDARNVVAGPHQTSTAQSSKKVTPAPTQGLDATASNPSRFVSPNNLTLPALQLPAGYYAIYEQKSGLFVVSSAGNFSRAIPTQGYIYSEAVPPILTPSGQILYSGNGIWLTNIFGGTPTQIADLLPGQVITSIALSDDGKMIAWSTEPVDGLGVIDIHAGPLAPPAVIYAQGALDRPYYRTFAFSSCSPTQAH